MRQVHWCLYARMVYVAERDARLEVSVATLATRAALLSMSCNSIVQWLVAAAARLSRYPLRRSSVSGWIVVSNVAAWAISPVAVEHPEARRRRLWARWATR